MTPQERFGIYSRTGIDPMRKVERPKIGKLMHFNDVMACGNFALLQLKKKELIQRGFKKENLKITY